MREALQSLLGRKLPLQLENALERLLQVDRLESLYQEVRSAPDPNRFVENFLDRLEVHASVAPRDLELVPRSGPVVVVANHPFGLIEGAVLTRVLSAIRPDVKVMANYLLQAMPEAARHCIFVDPFGTAASARFNQRGLKDSIAWLRRGSLLAVFPAGEVAHLNLRERAVIDPEWNQNIARIIRMTGATALPCYFVGANRAAFQLLGLLHPGFRTALLAHEFLNKSRRTIELRIGAPIAAEKSRVYQDDLALTRYLRHRTYLLQNRTTVEQISRPTPVAAVRATPADLIASEIAALPPNRTLTQTKAFSVLLGRMSELPNTVREIGRLRELAFRQAGEGSGKDIDLDEFDQHYWHLFLWSREAREIAGAYRLGRSEEILPSLGENGFYTSRLFAWKRPFLERIRPAVELGRSFVRSEYQKNFAPLLMLWKGIGQFLIQNPQYKILFGPVSISNDYSATARQLMVQFLSSYCRSRDLAPLVSPRRPLRARRLAATNDLISGAAADLDELSAMIADIEADRKGVPILLKHYLKLGGELAAFNVDRDFCDTLDGLIVVDLRKTERRTLERYLGKPGAAAYLAHV